MRRIAVLNRAGRAAAQQSAAAAVKRGFITQNCPRVMRKGPPNGEETFAGARNGDGDAPIAVTLSRLQLLGAA